MSPFVGEVRLPVHIPAELAESITKCATCYDLPTKYATVGICFLDPKKGKCPSAPPINGVNVNPYELEKGWLLSCLAPESCTPWATFHSESDTKKPHVRILSFSFLVTKI